MKHSLVLVAFTLLSASPGVLQAQSVLLDWDHDWDYLHPNRGALPNDAGATTLHPAGSAEWFADEATFNASYTGPSWAAPGGPGYVAGSGPGPLGYGAVNYINTPNPAPAEFTGLGTTLTTPASGQRNTIYFRTTFTVPDDGETYDSPVIRYLLDDGGFIYLDGELILEVNMAPGATDDFLATAQNTTDTEEVIRDAELDLLAGSQTGGSDLVVPAVGGNAFVVKQIAELAPGEHTLAVALHNQSTTSSDQIMAVQLVAGTPACVLDATVSAVNINPNNTVDVTVNVVPTGIFGASWTVTEPAGSVAAGQGGAYNTDIVIAGIPSTEFTGGSLTLTLADIDDPLCTDRVPISLPVIIALDTTSGPGEGVPTTGALPAGWVIDSGARTLTMNNGGGGARQIVRSAVLDLSGTRAVQFNGIFEVNDVSSGNEANDSFVAFLIIDGDAANPVNLITPHDTIIPDGELSDDELAPAPGNFIYPLEFLIPANADSVQLVIEGINNSGSETFIVRDLVFSRPPPGALPPFFDVNRDGANLVLTWESQGGSLYNIRSETDPSNGDPATWPIFDTLADIVATPPLNTLTIPRPADRERYFVVESFPAPPDSVFSDDFESGQGGWTFGNDGDPGTSWELGAPGVPGLAAANSPTNCFGTNLLSDYDTFADVWLRSPPIDLTAAGSATLSYFEFYDIELMFDSAEVNLLDAADDSVLAVIKNPFDGNTLDWEQFSKAIPAAALGKVIKIEFRLTTDDIGNFAGWYIDDVLVTIP